ncbi:nucleotidyl transferase AbiEii/AbiGii toxin family protein [Patescibacteria group bacterium]|nr:nucleotidyl transferase AbiEii/AbiGii toxin family protein [Patescibacteria group bacterium]
MISHKFINELSVKNQTSEENIAREYCQHLFLSYLYKKNGSEKMLFKGGTALRIVFQSPRFSEDLDFSAANELTIADINKLINATLDEIKKEGINCEKTVNAGTEGETSEGYFCLVNLKLLDFNSKIKIQVSFRQAKEMSSNSILIQSDFLPPYTIIFLGENKLVAEKVLALLDRAKPRDYFDLYFILRNPELKNYVPKLENLKDKLLALLAKQNGWEKELKIFLPVGHHQLLKDFKERLAKEVELRVSNN